MMKTKITRAWVADDFHKLLKTEATKQNKSIIELTEQLALDDNPLNELFDQKKKRGKNVFYY